MDLSVVIPIKDEKDNLRPLHKRLRRALDPLGLSYEVVVVDDGSTDGSYTVLTEIAAADPLVRVVRLRRNFGQTAAMQAGIDWSCGDILVTMDGDLQNDPSDIPRLLEKINEGYDAVLGLRARRQDDFLIRKLPSHIGNWLIRKVTGSQFKDMGCTLRALRRDLARGLPLYGEMHRLIPVLAQQYGGRITQIPVNHYPRTAGKTKYGLTRTFRVVLDLMTVKFMHSYITRPMHVMGFLGLMSMGLGFLSLLLTVAMKMVSGTYMTGNPFLLLSVLLEMIGVQLISMGLIGEVVTRTYFESQGKTSYTLQNTLNLDEMPRPRKAA
jgi:glycosyltransferase involved in cell wall biosynthesis